MISNIKILSARRSYEFHVDDLRLTLLSLPIVRQQIQQKYQFQNAAIGIPMETFGPVLPMLPPGVVFDIGAWTTSEDKPLPIRFIHFEQRRVVIDIVGDTKDIDYIFNDMTSFLSTLTLPDGTRAIGTPQEVKDYSEITATFTFNLEELISNVVKDIFLTHMFQEAHTVVPMLSFQVIPTNEEFIGISPSSSGFYQLTVRAGSLVNERNYFSVAPLSTEAHLQYLEKIDQAMSAR